MHAATRWVNRHDSVKLILITMVMIPLMRLGLAVSDNGDLLPLVGLLGMAVCGAGAYWVGTWKWLLIPVLGMLVEIAFAIPASMGDPNAMETPLSIVLEAPFWTGIPALIGAGVGYLIKRGNG